MHLAQYRILRGLWALGGARSPPAFKRAIPEAAAIAPLPAAEDVEASLESLEEALGGRADGELHSA